MRKYTWLSLTDMLVIAAIAFLGALAVEAAPLLTNGFSLQGPLHSITQPLHGDEALPTNGFRIGNAIHFTVPHNSALMNGIKAIEGKNVRITLQVVK